MKVLKRILSVFLSLAIVISMICMGSVSAGAAELNKPTIDLFENNNKTYLIFRMPVDELWEIYSKSASKEKTYFNIAMRIEGYEFNFSATKTYEYTYFITNPSGKELSTGSYTSNLYKDGWQLVFGSSSDIGKALSSASVITYSYVLESESGECFYGDHATHTKLIISDDNKMPEANGKTSERKYDVQGYYMSNDKYCIEIGGIAKEEYDYLYAIDEYFEHNGITYIQFIDFDNDFELSHSFYNIYGETYNHYYLGELLSPEETDFVKGEFEKDGSNYKYLFYIDLSDNDINKKMKEQLKKSKTGTASISIHYYNSKEFHTYYGKELNLVDTKYTFYDKINETSNNSSYSKSISTLKFSEISKKNYTGENRKASVTIKDGDYTLKKGTDYTLTYKNCKNIGTASVTIKGKGKYTGTKTLTYKIVPKKTTLTAEKKSSSKVKLSWTDVKGAEKYQIYYSVDGGKSYKKLAAVSGDKTSCTVKKLDFEKNDYKFKVRSYKKVDGKKYYSSFSKTVTVK